MRIKKTYVLGLFVACMMIECEAGGTISRLAQFQKEQSSKDVTMRVRGLTGTLYQFTLPSHSDITDVKKELQKHNGHPAGLYTLFLGDEALQNGRTVGSLGENPDITFLKEQSFIVNLSLNAVQSNLAPGGFTAFPKLVSSTGTLEIAPEQMGNDLNYLRQMIRDNFLSPDNPTDAYVEFKNAGNAKFISDLFSGCNRKTGIINIDMRLHQMF